MKTLISLFSIILCLSYGKAQWIELDTGMENPPVFNDVYAITPDIVVVVGANGTILKTTDGGETWVQKPSGSTADIRKVQFPTSEIGYAVTVGDALLKTTDGGEIWEVVDVGVDCFFYDFSCVDENLIFISCSGNLLKSQDGGEVWDNIGSLPGVQMQFLNNEIGFIYSEWTFDLLKTENGGGEWNEITGLAPFQFLDENIGFYYNQGLYKTINGGNDFELQGNGEEDLFSNIFVAGENIAWGTLMPLLNGDGSTRGILKVTASETEPYTEDIWYDNDPGIDMYSIHFADENTGYIVGIKDEKGTIWKNGTGVNTMSTNEEERNNEIKVYPNPASKEINIEFNKPVSDNIKVLFTSLAGKKMYERFFSNTNKLNIDIEQFPKGIYILSIEINQKKYSQKIIIN